jgi:hypothetical protein
MTFSPIDDAAHIHDVVARLRRITAPAIGSPMLTGLLGPHLRFTLSNSPAPASPCPAGRRGPGETGAQRRLCFGFVNVNVMTKVEYAAFARRLDRREQIYMTRSAASWDSVCSSSLGWPKCLRAKDEEADASEPQHANPAIEHHPPKALGKRLVDERLG